MTKRTLLTAVAPALVAALMVAVVPAAAQSEGRIAGIVYADKNGNGTRDEGEEGVEGAQITLVAGDFNTTVASKADGSFSIDLAPGTYSVTVKAPTGYNAPTNPTVQVVIQNAGDVVSNLAFGVIPAGTVLPESGGPIPGALVIAALLAILLLGVGLVAVGQRKSRAGLV